MERELRLLDLVYRKQVGAVLLIDGRIHVIQRVKLCMQEFLATTRLFKMERSRLYDDFQLLFIVRASCHQK